MDQLCNSREPEEAKLIDGVTVPRTTVFAVIRESSSEDSVLIILVFCP